VDKKVMKRVGVYLCRCGGELKPFQEMWPSRCYLQDLRTLSYCENCSSCYLVEGRYVNGQGKEDKKEHGKTLWEEEG